MNAAGHDGQLPARDISHHQLAGMADHGGEREAGNLAIGKTANVFQLFGKAAAAAATVKSVTVNGVDA